MKNCKIKNGNNDTNVEIKTSVHVLSGISDFARAPPGSEKLLDDLMI